MFPKPRKIGCTKPWKAYLHDRSVERASTRDEVAPSLLHRGIDVEISRVAKDFCSFKLHRSWNRIKRRNIAPNLPIPPIHPFTGERTRACNPSTATWPATRSSGRTSRSLYLLARIDSRATAIEKSREPGFERWRCEKERAHRLGTGVSRNTTGRARLADEPIGGAIKI